MKKFSRSLILHFAQDDTKQMKALWSILFLIAAGCTEYTFIPPPAGPPGPSTPVSSSHLFDYTPTDPKVTRSPLPEEDGAALERIEMDGLEATYARPLRSDGGSTRRPAVMILPAFWGDKQALNFARYFAEKGMISFELTSRRYTARLRQIQEMTAEALAEALRQDVILARRSLDWLTAQPDVDPARVGVLGISVGAIVASVAAEVDPRITAAVYVLGGGDITEILLSSEGYVSRRLRRKLLDHNTLSADEFRKKAEDTFRPVDPLTHAGHLSPQRILMVNASFDRVVPEENARQLWEAIGRPTWLMIPTGHHTATLFNSYVHTRAWEHFSRTWDSPPRVESRLFHFTGAP